MRLAAVQKHRAASWLRMASNNACVTAMLLMGRLEYRSQKTIIVEATIVGRDGVTSIVVVAGGVGPRVVVKRLVGVVGGVMSVEGDDGGLMVVVVVIVEGDVGGLMVVGVVGLVVGVVRLVVVAAGGMVVVVRVVVVRVVVVRMVVAAVGVGRRVDVICMVVGDVGRLVVATVTIVGVGGREVVVKPGVGGRLVVVPGLMMVGVGGLDVVVCPLGVIGR